VRTVVDVVAAVSAPSLALLLLAAPIAPAAPRHPADNPDCASAQLDSCYRADQMNVFAADGERMVTHYLTQIGVTTESEPTFVFIPSGGTVGSRCVDVNGDDRQHDRSFDYCPTDNAVYIGQNALWDAYRQYRATGALSGLAHEYGHFLQSKKHVPLPRTAGDTIRNENQADCFSGAFIGHLRETLSAAEDITNIERYLSATASEEAPGRDHGTARERVESFALGYAGALQACSAFYPATPLTG